MDITQHAVTADHFERAQASDMREFAFVNLPHVPHRAIDAWAHDGTDEVDIDGRVFFQVFEAHEDDESQDPAAVYNGIRKNVAFYAATGAVEARALLVALVLHYAKDATIDV